MALRILLLLQFLLLLLRLFAIMTYLVNYTLGVPGYYTSLCHFPQANREQVYTLGKSSGNAKAPPYSGEAFTNGAY